MRPNRCAERCTGAPLTTRFFHCDPHRGRAVWSLNAGFNPAIETWFSDTRIFFKLCGQAAERHPSETGASQRSHPHATPLEMQLAWISLHSPSGMGRFRGTVDFLPQSVDFRQPDSLHRLAHTVGRIPNSSCFPRDCDAFNKLSRIGA